MSRAALAYATPAYNAALADPAGTASVAGAGNGFVIPAAGGPAVPELTMLRCSNASGGSGTVSVLAGLDPVLAESAGQGALTATVANSAVSWLGPFDSARFLQHDGSLLVETSVVMTITAFKVPRH